MVKYVIGVFVVLAGLGLSSHVHAGTTALVSGVNGPTCITMDGATAPGTYARAGTCDGSATQQWNTQAISFGYSPNAKATVRFVNALSGLCLDSVVGTNAGVVQNTCSDSLTQQWVTSEPGVFASVDGTGTTQVTSRMIRTQSGACLNGSAYPPASQTPFRNVNTTACSDGLLWYLDFL